MPLCSMCLNHQYLLRGVGIKNTGPILVPLDVIDILAGQQILDNTRLRHHQCTYAKYAETKMMCGLMAMTIVRKSSCLV